MHRRMLIASLATAALTERVMAQATQYQPQPGAAAAPGPDELAHAKETLAIGSVLLATSQEAVTKGSAAIKGFAEKEVAEQEAVAAVLKARGHSPAPALEPEGQSMVGRLKNTNAGEEFDKAYLQHQLDAHRRAFEAQERYLKGGKDPYSIAVATLTRGHIREHIDLLQSLSKQPN